MRHTTSSQPPAYLHDANFVHQEFSRAAPLYQDEVNKLENSLACPVKELYENGQDRARTRSMP